MCPDFDYSLCEKEPLAHSGLIQGVGVLCCVDLDGLVTHISDNTHLIHSAEASQWLGYSVLPKLWPKERDLLATLMSKEQSMIVLSGARTFEKRKMELVGRHVGDSILLEWMPELPLSSAPNISLSPTLSVGDAVSVVLNAIHQFIAFDRILAYRLEDDDSGTVFAEKNNGCEHSVLGLRYTSSDIPKIVRQLFIVQGYRYIADAEVQSVPILAFNDQPADLDLSLAQLRSISPYHVRYLKALGISSSSSFPIIVGEQLWGLVTVQSRRPQHLSFSSLRAIEKMVRVFSTHICQKRLSEFYELQTQSGDYLERLCKAGSNAQSDAVMPEISDFFVQHCACDGLAIYCHEQWLTWGVAPQSECLNQLLSALVGNKMRGKLIQDCFSSKPYGLVDFPEQICGLAATWFHGRKTGSRLACLLFKKEAITTVLWGSRPQSLGDAQQFGPHASFGQWQEALKGRSLHWPFRTELVLQLMMDKMLKMHRQTL